MNVDKLVSASIDFLSAYLLARMEGKPVRQSEEAALAIRGIYFSPQGILPILKALHDGAPITRDELRSALVKFADGQQHVERQLRHLDWGALRRDLGLDIRTMRALETLGLEKIGLRSGIIRFVQELWQAERKPRGWKENLRHLIERIEELNNAIEEMDGTLNDLLARGQQA